MLAHSKQIWQAAPSPDLLLSWKVGQSSVELEKHI